MSKLKSSGPEASKGEYFFRYSNSTKVSCN